MRNMQVEDVKKEENAKKKTKNLTEKWKTDVKRVTENPKTYKGRQRWNYENDIH